MLSRKTILALLFTLVVPSVMLVAMQQDSTNRRAPENMILFGYVAGTGPLEVVGSEAAVSIVEARCLIRGMLVLCKRVLGEGLVLYNARIQFFFIWGALCMIYLTAARLMPPARAYVAVLAAVVFVPWGYMSVGLSVSWPYDLPALFFSALGIWAIVARRFWVFAVAIAVGTLNKETVVFLIPAYVLSEWPLLPRKTLILHALTLAVLFLVPYEVPRMILAGNSQPVATFSATEWEVPRWQANLQHLGMMKRSSAFENVYWAMTLHLLPLLRVSTLPRPLRMIYLAAPVLLVPIFFLGNIYELRLYNEIIPLGAISTVIVLSNLLFESPAAPAAISPDSTVP